ncbi:MAG: hypothetical protein AAGJ10_04655 [Bacteroidota bacterium]
MPAFLKQLHLLRPKHIPWWRYRMLLGRRRTARRSIAKRKHWQRPASALRSAVPTAWTTNPHNTCQS